MIATRIPPGVVADEPLTRALLYAAVNERLLDDEPSIGDGFVANLLRRPPERDVIDQAFEQIVLGGKFLVPFLLPRNWQGELMENEVIEELPFVPREELVEVPQMPPDLVLGMLAARGIPWTDTQLRERYDRFMHTYRAWESVADGKSFDGLQVRMALRGIMPIEEKELSPEQIARWEDVQREYANLQPVRACIESYQSVITASLIHGALSGLPVIPSIMPELVTGAEGDLANRLTLLRITCKQLRRISFGTTLRETLHIARSPEAMALRAKLAEWTDVLRRGEVEAAGVIATEIEKSRNELKGAKRLERFGAISTWVGIPVAIASAFLTAGVSAAVGIGAATAGTIALAKQEQIARANRWAMFG